MRKGKLFIEKKKKIKKNQHWVDLYHYKVVVYTHCQHTFQFKQLVKVHVASDEPFNSLCDLALDLIIVFLFLCPESKISNMCTIRASTVIHVGQNTQKISSHSLSGGIRFLRRSLSLLKNSRSFSLELLQRLCEKNTDKADSDRIKMAKYCTSVKHTIL